MDLRYRTIAGRDLYYVLAGGTGLVLLLLDGGWRQPTEILSMVAGLTLVLILYRFKVVASGDCIILLVVCVSLPSIQGIQFLPVLLVLGSIVLLACSLIMYNLTLNTTQIIRRRSSPFARYKETRAKKMAAFLMAHQKRVWEKHVISIEDQNCNKFSLFVIPFDRSWAHKGLVVIAAPVIPFLLVTLAVIVSVAGKAQYIT